MAMRGRGGRGNPTRPPRLIINRVYEEFIPMSERRQEEDHDLLLLYLPGFQKEYIKVTTEDANIVRIRGERLVSENKWSRFQEDYRAPENCEMRGIRAKFDGGILTITMPRKITNAPPPPPPTTAKVASKTEEQTFRRTKQEETPRKPEENLKKPDKPQIASLEENTLPVPPKATSSSTPTKQPSKLATKTKEPSKPEPQANEPSKHEPQANEPSKPEPQKKEPSKPEPQAKEAVELTTGTLPRVGFGHDVEKPGVGKMDLEKGKEATLKKEIIEEKPNSSGVVGGDFRAGLKKFVEMRGMMSEDRKLLVNVGVSVLVIAALGVHVSYTVGLIGKRK
ncbi:hypothetical protein R6Q59_029185 [Mikania micrantha]|uniref:SHSP domain-containing protein n=1 Tax=Mikania micrantha TaxID=192012 RepID=A0A5N6LL67_9ASTR|nr:hypothetical protein E3N88_41554 [Mikania micrantha]